MRDLRKGVSSFDAILLTSLLFVGSLGVAGGAASGALRISLRHAEDVEAEHVHVMMQRIQSAATFEDLLSYADTPSPEATAPRPAYVEVTRATWYAALQGAPPGRASLGQGHIKVTHRGSAPTRLAIIEVRIEPSRRDRSIPTSLVTFRAE